MAERAGHLLNIAMASFNIGVYRLLHGQIDQLRSFRLLPIFQPGEGRDLSLRPRAGLSIASTFRRSYALPLLSQKHFGQHVYPL